MGNGRRRQVHTLHGVGEIRHNQELAARVRYDLDVPTTTPARLRGTAALLWGSIPWHATDLILVLEDGRSLPIQVRPYGRVIRITGRPFLDATDTGFASEAGSQHPVPEISVVDPAADVDGPVGMP